MHGDKISCLSNINNQKITVIPTLFDTKNILNNYIDNQYLRLNFITNYNKNVYFGKELFKDFVHYNWTDTVNFKLNNLFYTYKALYYKQGFVYSEYFK